uniref:Olfactory receptor n=1 Tax=Podarcis muralis TaxID=64176 RepID=A0A670IWD7_PODMU
MKDNITETKEFYLIELSDVPEVRISLFLVFLLIYLITLAGNGAIILAIAREVQLQTPMYFFLSNLSFLDILSPTVTVPKMLQVFMSEDKTISFAGCVLQLFLLIDFVGTEVFLLAVMAYDRYVAICSPLHYTNIMSTRLCMQLAAGSWLATICGIVNSTVHTVFIFSLSFCNSNVINHFFCDTPPILKLSCSDTHTIDILHFILSTIIALTTFVIILVSYMYILLAILKIRSPQGQQKAFSTCASHLTAVAIFYGTIIFMYLRPSSSFSMDQDKIVSLFYTLVIPMLNPLIYSLRNKDVKDNAFLRMKGNISLN